MNRINSVAFAGLVEIVILAGVARADQAVQPQPVAAPPKSGSPSIEVFYDFGSKTRYETDMTGYGNTVFDISRKTALAQVSYGDFFVSGGVTHEARIEPRAEMYYPMPLAESSAYGYPRYNEPEDPSGKGFLVSAGLRTTVWQQDKFSLQACGQLTYRRESYDATATYSSYPVYAEASTEIWPSPDPMPQPITITETYEINLRGAELSAGLTGSFTGSRYTVYAGLELLAYSNLEADVKVTSSDGSSYSGKSDMDRNDMVTMLLGLKASFDPWYILVETRAVGESSLRAGAGLAF